MAIRRMAQKRLLNSNLHSNKAKHWPWVASVLGSVFLGRHYLTPCLLRWRHIRKMSFFSEVTGPRRVKAELIYKSGLPQSVAHFLLYIRSFYHPHLNSIWGSHRIILLYAFFFILCMFYLNACVYHVCAVPFEARRGRQILWNWSHRWI